MTSLDQLSASELDELASEIRSFANSRAYDYVFAALQQKYVAVLLAANVGDLTATSAHASMKVLEDVKGEFQVFENEVAMRGSKRVRSR